MEGQTTQWPSERRVNGRTDNAMAIRKKGKWKDRFTLLFGGLCCLFFHLLFFLVAIVLSVLPFTLFLMAIIRTDNTMAIRKKGKWKNRQCNGHQKEG
jgi:membrane glycosyltransferase